MPDALADQFLTQAGWIEAGGRSPLYAALMRGAAADIAANGIVARLFERGEHPRESVPQLRLLAPLHELALAGRAPALAAFYPSAGGHGDPAEAWPVARDALAEHEEWVRGRLGATVQTNDPGRACALMFGLRRLAERDGRPVRLLELGASAGLNLMADRFAYRVGATTLGDPGSPLRFEHPWPPGTSTGPEPLIADRAGCDLSPLDPSREEDRLRLLSYVWPDEPDRIERLRTALELAAADPHRQPVERASAASWLVTRLAEPAAADHLTVVWHSIFWQYLPENERRALEALNPTEDTPDLAWLSMEPWHEPDREVRLTVRGPGGQPARTLAICDDHGPPLRPL